ncbi:DUF305 domain-containing protein [Actinocorallia sp. B10E7]|uniref:DUF305 domain-containing protein n=1 Tax=Actinocorallia sp. B10E7 TaxID=3153558 RepID=UPI00325F65B3
MSGRSRAGRVFSAVGFMVIGAVATLLLSGLGSSPGAARVSPAGAVDIGFSQDMVVHHQQAVTMAQTVRGRVGPSVSQVAGTIELGQLKEIGLLQGWLALWDAPQVSSGPPMAWMAPGSHDHASTSADADHVMPGMASLDELDRLGEAEGEDLEVWFLQLMIRHHQGGVAMATAAARRATVPQVRDLAVLMATEQRKETALMTGLLDALGHRPLPLPATGPV